MYIKQIIIQGFKSYKTQTVIEPFSDKTNVIVGRNGSGKSNFFAAIRFVLSDAYTQMSREERQGLLHEGSGSAVTSAYVEIIFDNSDNRFLQNNKEVVLRRTISLNKDEYSVDRKVVTKSEVLDMLEGAGFSRSNPYYIVPQGRVTALTNMKEADRLNLLKEIAGTRVYEARRTESLKIMADTNHKREKIDELLTDVKARLAELEEEKEELRGYQTKEREKRCLEYSFYALEEARVKKLLDEIENLRQGGLESTDSTRADLAECESTIANLDDKIHRLQRELQLCEITRRQVNEDRLEGTKAQAQAELKAKTLSDGQSAQEQARQERDGELKSTRKGLEEKKAELAKVTSDYNKKKLKEDSIKKDLDSAVATRERLFTKQKNGSRFKNKKERDNELRKELQEVNLALADQKANRMDAEEETKARQQMVKKMEGEIVVLRDRLSNWGSNRTSLAQEATDSKDRHDSLQEERKKLRRDQEKLESVLTNVRSEQEHASGRVAKMMDNTTSRGLRSIHRIKEEQGIEGAYGTVAELIEVIGPYQLPIETIAGGSLFHYVVDNADTATKIGKMLYDKRGGRVTMIPLREIDVKNVMFPRSDDSIPMVEKLKFDPKFEKAIKHVFGKAVICPSLAVANQYARSHKLTAITLEGDIANKSGALTGGFLEGKHSRLDAVKEANRLSDEYASLRARHDELRRDIEQKDQEITKAAGEMRKLEAALDKEKQGFHPLQRELVDMNSQLGITKELLQESIERRDQIDINMREFTETIEAAEAEMASDFKKVLTAQEEQQMEELGTRVQQLQKQWSEISVARRQLNSRKNALEVEITKNLQLKLDALMSQAVEDAASSGSAEGVKGAMRELKKAQQALAATVARFQEAEREVEQVQGKIETLQAERAGREETRRDIQTRIDKQQKRIEKNLSRKSLLVQEMADLTKSIRDLGVLPEEAFEKYRKMDAKTIVNRLKKVNEALKKYKHVNKKAFEQYNSFMTQQEQLLERRSELDKSKQSIIDLVEVLDNRKDEAIERTFKQVSLEFAQIFEKLVPAGHGRLVIMRRSDKQAQQQPEEESDDETRQNDAVENYIGVGISVAFNSKTMDEQQKIQQLSGGQKSLCALCLIFALQQTESSPMVIFDEVDANLDAQYRTAVAGLLESISNEAGTQFICTTFRPEIVLVADKCYGVTFTDKTSSIDCVPTEDALNFVEGQAKGT